MALESPESFLRGSEEDRELRGKNALFTSESCQRELNACKKGLGKAESWETALAASGIESLEVITESTSDYQSIVTAFSSLTTRQRAANAARVIPQIMAAINGLQNNGSSAEQLDVLTAILAVAEVISQFILAFTGVDLTILITVGTIVLDLVSAFASGNPITIIRAIISTIIAFVRGLGRNLRTINLFASADSECMAELMTCNESDFLNKVVPDLITLSKL